MYVCMYVCMYYVCMYVCMYYVCVRACVCTYVCVYFKSCDTTFSVASARPLNNSSEFGNCSTNVDNPCLLYTNSFTGHTF